MGISERWQRMSDATQEGLRFSLLNFTRFALRVFTGGALGLTFAIVGDEIMSYGQVAFYFTLLLVAGLFWRASAKWSLFYIVIFNIVCVLLALCLRLYIMIAPG